MTKPFRASLLIAVGIGSMGASGPRQPTARWVVNYDDAQCVASRNYGTADKPLFLALKPSPTGSVMRVMLIRNGPSSAAEQRPASIRLDGKPAIAAKALSFGDPKTKQFVASINLPMATFAANRRASSIEIRGSWFNEQLALPGLTGVMAAFDDCLANLRKVWNVGEDYSSGIMLEARAKRPLGQLFRSSTYPAQAIREGDSGRVGLALLIDEAGKVRDCMIDETSGFATLDTMSCYTISTHAQFEPALGADGRPTKSASFHRIKWRIGP
ncbi:MAG: TonB family protein [Sphingomicrobium sp.]